jgi:uncharacterized protein
MDTQELPEEERPEATPGADDEPALVEVVERYESGAVKEVATLRDGKPHGKVTLYREDGSLESSAEYDDGVLHGAVEVFDEAGRLSQTAVYLRGKIEGEVVVFTGGVVAMKMSMSGGKQHGPTTTYDEKGTLTGYSEFVEGLQEGESRWYGEDGQVIRTAQYRSGLLAGMMLDYYGDGAVRRATPYVDGVVQGEVVTYDQGGDVTEREVVEPVPGASLESTDADSDPTWRPPMPECGSPREGAAFSGFFGRFRRN